MTTRDGGLTEPPEPDPECPCCRVGDLLEEYQRQVVAAAEALQDVLEATEWPGLREHRGEALPHLRTLNEHLKAAWAGAMPVGEAFGLSWAPRPDDPAGGAPN